MNSLMEFMSSGKRIIIIEHVGEQYRLDTLHDNVH